MIEPTPPLFMLLFGLYSFVAHPTWSETGSLDVHMARQTGRLVNNVPSGDNSPAGFCFCEEFGSLPVRPLTHFPVPLILCSTCTLLSKRPIGRTKTRWEDDVLEDIKSMSVRNWKKVAQNRHGWKKVVE